MSLSRLSAIGEQSFSLQKEPWQGGGKSFKKTGLGEGEGKIAQA